MLNAVCPLQNIVVTGCPLPRPPNDQKVYQIKEKKKRHRKKLERMQCPSFVFDPLFHENFPIDK
jgi:hypothetical protein